MTSAASFWNGLAVAVAVVGVVLLLIALFVPGGMPVKGPLIAFGGFAFVLAFAFREKSDQAAG